MTISSVADIVRTHAQQRRGAPTFEFEVRRTVTYAELDALRFADLYDTPPWSRQWYSKEGVHDQIDGVAPHHGRGCGERASSSSRPGRVILASCWRARATSALFAMGACAEMGRVEASQVIATGPEPIWDLMSDPSRYPDFVDATERMVDIGRGAFGVGYVYKEYGGIKPFLSESEWRVTEFEPMRHQAHIGDDGKMRMPLGIDLEPVDGGTKLTITFALQPRWFLAPVNAVLWPLMMRRRTQTVIDRTVANAKRIVEA